MSYNNFVLYGNDKLVYFSYTGNGWTQVDSGTASAVYLVPNTTPVVTYSAEKINAKTKVTRRTRNSITPTVILEDLNFEITGLFFAHECLYMETFDNNIWKKCGTNALARVNSVADSAVVWAWRGDIILYNDGNSLRLCFSAQTCSSNNQASINVPGITIQGASLAEDGIMALRYKAETQWQVQLFKLSVNLPPSFPKFFVESNTLDEYVAPNNDEIVFAELSTFGSVLLIGLKNGGTFLFRKTTTPGLGYTPAAHSFALSNGQSTAHSTMHVMQTTGNIPTGTGTSTLIVEGSGNDPLQGGTFTPGTGLSFFSINVQNPPVISVSVSQEAEIVVEIDGQHPNPAEVAVVVKLRAKIPNYVTNNAGTSPSHKNVFLPIVSTAEQDLVNANTPMTVNDMAAKFDHSSHNGAVGPAVFHGYTNPNTSPAWLRPGWTYVRPVGPVLEPNTAFIEYQIRPPVFTAANMGPTNDGTHFNFPVCGGFISSDAPGDTQTGTTQWHVNHYSCTTISVTLTAQGSAFTSIRGIFEGNVQTIAARLFSTAIKSDGTVVYVVDVTATPLAGAPDCVQFVADNPVNPNNIVFGPGTATPTQWTPSLSQLTQDAASCTVRVVLTSTNKLPASQSEVTGSQVLNFRSTVYAEDYSIEVTLNLFRSVDAEKTGAIGVTSVMFKQTGELIQENKPAFQHNEKFYLLLCAVDPEKYVVKPSAEQINNDPISCTVETDPVGPIYYNPASPSTTGCMDPSLVNPERRTGIRKLSEGGIDDTYANDKFNYFTFNNHAGITLPGGIPVGSDDITPILNANGMLKKTNCALYKFSVKPWARQNTNGATYLQIPVDTKYEGNTIAPGPGGAAHGGLASYNGRGKTNNKFSESKWVDIYRKTYNRNHNAITLVFDNKKNTVYVENGLRQSSAKGHADENSVSVLKLDSPYHLSFNGFKVVCGNSTLFAQIEAPGANHPRHECIHASEYSKMVDSSTGTVWYKSLEKKNHGWWSWDDDDDHDSGSSFFAGVIAAMALVFVLFVTGAVLYYCCFKSYYGLPRKTKIKSSRTRYSLVTLPNTHASDYSSSDDNEAGTARHTRSHRVVETNNNYTFMMKQAQAKN
jgi:hypothetical protein